MVVLPTDIFDCVTKKLSVFDRVRLGIALGKSFYRTRCAPEIKRNRRLGILYRCLKRRRPDQELTPSILEYIQHNLNDWDTTFDDLDETFVQLKRVKEHVKQHKYNSYESFLNKLRNAPENISFGNVDEFLENATPERIDHVISIIQSSTLEMSSSTMMFSVLLQINKKGSIFIEQCIKRGAFTSEEFAGWAYHDMAPFIDSSIITGVIQITGIFPGAHLLEYKLQDAIDSMQTHYAENMYKLIQVIYPPSRDSAPE
jgi:hypothetical protein